jgi:kinesin family protein 1
MGIGAGIGVLNQDFCTFVPQLVPQLHRSIVYTYLLNDTTMSGEAIRVAVRVRPFAGYEKEKGAKNVVSMNSGTQQTVIEDPSTGKKKSFTFDYSFNSHVDSSHPDYASNDDVYNKLGVSVLDNAWNGFNCCLFAYGQTGSGKSYSMMGYGEDKGIIPRAVAKIFDRISDTADATTTYHVECSMLEIYNEQIRDLFSSVPRNKMAKGGLKVRDSAATGPFVMGLTKNA